jgi:hypothetical protein
MVLRRWAAVTLVSTMASLVSPPSSYGVELPSSSRFEGGFFSIDAPEGWEVHIGGHCSLFGFVLRDPSRPARQVFYFGSIGPLMLSQQQRELDLWYVQAGGYPIPYLEFPVLEPATTTNFMSLWPAIAQTQIMANFLPASPMLMDFTPTAESQIETPLAQFGGTASLFRGFFVEGNELAEGLFSVTLVPEMGNIGGPGGNTGRSVSFTGITAPKREFAALERELARIAGSLSITQDYVRQCIAESQAQWEAARGVGETLRETTEIVNSWWDARQASEDIMIEKRADGILGVERMYDPDTRQVYEFPDGFSDTYELDPGKYKLDNLQPLPADDHSLWTQAPLDGPRALE